MRGVLEHTSTPFSVVGTFVRPYTQLFNPNVKDIVDLENPLPSPQAELPAAQAVEFLADMYEQEKTSEGISYASEVLGSSI